MAEVFEDTRVVTNPGPDPLRVWFEPWGMPHFLPPGESFRVVGRSPQAGTIEVVESGGTVAVYAWAGSTLMVFNGTALVEDLSVAVPELPPGQSTRSFVHFLFGGPGDPKPDASPAAATGR